MNEHLKDVRKILRRPGLPFITVAGIDVSTGARLYPSSTNHALRLIQFLIEVRLKESVPDQWVKISSCVAYFASCLKIKLNPTYSTKAMARYHTPKIIEL